MKREEFKHKTRELLNELIDYISKLEDKAGEIADEARDAYRERIDYLKDVKDRLSSKLEEYENIADGKWDVVRDSAADFFVSVSDAWKENYAKVADAFKKEDDQQENEK